MSELRTPHPRRDLRSSSSPAYRFEALAFWSACLISLFLFGLLERMHAVLARGRGRQSGIAGRCRAFFVAFFFGF